MGNSSSSGGGSSSGVPAAGVVIRLTWDTSQTDLDVHLVRENPSGVFTRASVNDCYYANCKGTTSVIWDGLNPAGTGGNPHLDVDDLMGLGPEFLTVQQPLPNRYKVLVHFYSDSFSMPQGATATLEVFFNGVSAARLGRAVPVGSWWDVGNVVWPGLDGGPTQPTFVAIDQLELPLNDGGVVVQDAGGGTPDAAVPCNPSSADVQMCARNGGLVDANACLCVDPTGMGGCDFGFMQLQELFVCGTGNVRPLDCGCRP
jgi:hypothetical protein